jgi:hypothetical protein
MFLAHGVQNMHHVKSAAHFTHHVPNANLCRGKIYRVRHIECQSYIQFLVLDTLNTNEHILYNMILCGQNQARRVYRVPELVCISRFV